MCWPGVGKHHLHRSLQCEDMQCCHIHPLLHTVHIWVCCGRRCKGSVTSCNVQTSRQHWWVGGPPTHVSGRFFPMPSGWRRLEDDDQALRCCLALAVNTFTWLRQLPLLDFFCSFSHLCLPWHALHLKPKTLWTLYSWCLSSTSLWLITDCFLVFKALG